MQKFNLFVQKLLEKSAWSFKSVNYRNNERLNSHIAQFKHYNFQQVGVWPSKERITILDNSVPCNAMTNEGGLYLWNAFVSFI